MMYALRILYIYMFVIALTPAAFAQRLIGKADKTTVGIGEPIVISYQLEGAIGSQFTPPDLPDNVFRVLSGPNQTIQMSSGNGVVSQLVAYSLVLSPSQLGDYVLPPASIRLNSKIVQSNNISIKVTDTPNRSQPSLSSPTSPPSNSGDDGIMERLKENIILRAEADKTSVYVGEPVAITYRLYKRETISPSIRMSLPTFDGFWTEDLKTSEMGRMGSLNGKSYEVFECRKMLAMPQKSGTLFLPELVIELEVILKDRTLSVPSIADIFRGRIPMGFQNVGFSAKNEKVPLTVKPLPEAGKPASFNGLVGKYGLSVEPFSKTAKTNEPIHLKVSLTGSGNIKMALPPKLNLPDGWEAFDPDKQDRILNSDEGTDGSITYDYTLVASKTGDFTLPPVEISFFNPETEKYEVLTSQSFPITISQGEIIDSETGEVQDSTRHSFFDFFGFPEVNNLFSLKVLLWALLLSLLIGGGVFVWRKKSRTIQPKTVNTAINNSDSHRTSINYTAHLHQAEKTEGNAFYEALSLALNAYIQEKFSQPSPAFTQPILKHLFESARISPLLLNTYFQITAECQKVLYTPVPPNFDKQTLLSQARLWITEIEKALSEAQKLPPVSYQEEDLL